MKINKREVIIMFLSILITLGMVYVYSNYKHSFDLSYLPSNNTDIGKQENPIPEKSVSSSSVVLSEGVTDIFHGKIISQINSIDKTTGGKLFNVEVFENKIYQTTGNAKGIVVVNDATDRFKIKQGIYGFRAKYNEKNKWYDIVTAVELPSQGGDE